MIWWRLRTVDNKTDCWVRYVLTQETINIARQMDAEIFSMINVIRFKCAEDITVFRLKADV